MADGDRFYVGRHYHRWAVWDLAELRGDVKAGPFDTREQAESAAARLNLKPRKDLR